MSNSLINLVKIYIDELNWSIIPIKKDKTPAVPTWKQYQEVKLTVPQFEDLIVSPSVKGKVFGIAVVTGKISNLTIVDFDNGSEDIFNGFLTPTVKTGSGGKHYFFKYAESLYQGSNRDLRIDIRNDGGYAILPPSRSVKGIYEWLKDYKTPMLDVPEDFIKSYTKNTTKITWSFDGVEEGGRNQASVHVAGKLVSNFREDLNLAWNSFVAWNQRNIPPIDEKELRTTFNWVVNADKKFHPEKYIEAQAEPIVPKEVKKLEDMELDELLAQEKRECLPLGVEEIDILFQHPAGFYVICANPGVGKGWWALWLSRKFWELHKKKTIYFSLEMSINLIKPRILQQWSSLTEKEYQNAIENDKTKLSKAVSMIRKGAIHIDEMGGSDTSVVKPEIFKKKIIEYYKQGYRIFHFDHLHELEGANVNNKNQEVVETWAKVFQGLCKDLPDIWLFVFAQPNGQAHMKKILTKNDVAGSKSIAQKCEFFYSLNRIVELDTETNSVKVVNDNREVVMFLDKNRITSAQYVAFNLYFSHTGNFLSKKRVGNYVGFIKEE
jgi:hypothetical protein